MENAKETNGPKIVSDNDWKQQAQKEKEKLSEKEKSRTPEASQSSGPMPPADFLMLVNSLAVQALFSLGKIGQEGQDKPPANFDMAKYHIDLLQMLEEKTRGNLTEQESQVLVMTLQEVRMQYVSEVQAYS